MSSSTFGSTIAYDVNIVHTFNTSVVALKSRGCLIAWPCWLNRVHGIYHTRHMQNNELGLGVYCSAALR